MEEQAGSRRDHDDELRRFGYFIPKPDGTIDVHVLTQVPSAAVLAEFHDLVKVIFRVQPIVVSLHIVENNVRDLVAAINNHRAQLDTLDLPSIASVENGIQGLIAASQHVSNFLGAATSFLALTEAQLGAGYGRDSPQWKAWNEQRKDFHAGSFAYRFLYELRNFSQHRFLPISNFNVSGEREADSEKLTFRVGLEVIRDSLLSQGYKWGNLTEELKRQPPKFDLMPLVHQFLAVLQVLCLEAFRTESQALAECARYLDVVKRKLAVPDGGVPVIFVGGSPAPGVPPGRYEMIPIVQLRWLLSEYDDLLNLHEPSC